MLRQAMYKHLQAM